VIALLRQIERQGAVTLIAAFNVCFIDNRMEEPMKTWNKPQVREQEIGLEVTSYLPAEIDII